MDKVVTMRIDEDVVTEIDRLADATDITRNAAMAQAMREYVERERWQYQTDATPALEA